MVLADPVGSVVADYIRTGNIGTAGSWLVEGIGEDFLPPIADLSRVKLAYSIPDAEAFAVVRTLLKREGILAGSSTGVLLAAALRYCREQTQPKTVVTLVCDTGSKYLSKLFNDFWLADQGMGGRASSGDLRDLISRPFGEGAVVAVAPDDPLTVTYQRMRLYDVSQLAVMDGEKLVGIVDEGDLLLAIRRDDAAFDWPVRNVMSANVRTIDHRAGFEELTAILDAGLVAVVSDQQGFHGMITRIDVLNFLRKERTKKTERK
jgi:cystathionine beta-synthase